MKYFGLTLHLSTYLLICNYSKANFDENLYEGFYNETFTDGLIFKVIFDQPSTKWKIFNTTLIQPVLSMWSSVLRPRKRTSSILHIPRTCKDGRGYIEHGNLICATQCNEHVKCGSSVISPNFLGACFSKQDDKLVQQYAAGIGQPADFVIYVNIANKANSLFAFAVAHTCAFDQHGFQPAVGEISICPDMLIGDSSKRVLYRNIIMHEVVHLLAFNSYLYAFYRFRNGTHRTSKAVEFIPLIGPQPTPSTNTVLTRTIYELRQGTMVGNTESLITLPAVVDVGKKYFKCDHLEGIPLENHPSNQLNRAHFETRILAQEIMAALPRETMRVTNFTLALLLETGWYDVSHAFARTMSWGKNMGCEFVTKTCEQYIESKRNVGYPASPFCDPVYQNRPVCLWDRSGYGHCDRTVTSSVLYNSSSNAYEDQCPMAIKGKVLESWDRISQDCKAQIKGQYENLALESFGPESICLDHVQHQSWAYSFGGYSIPLSTYGASCHQVNCTKENGLTIRFGSRWILCPSNGGPVSVNTFANGGRLTGIIYCPPCSSICDDPLCEELQ